MGDKNRKIQLMKQLAVNMQVNSGELLMWQNMMYAAECVLGEDNNNECVIEHIIHN